MNFTGRRTYGAAHFEIDSLGSVTRNDNEWVDRQTTVHKHHFKEKSSIPVCPSLNTRGTRQRRHDCTGARSFAVSSDLPYEVFNGLKSDVGGIVLHRRRTARVASCTTIREETVSRRKET